LNFVGITCYCIGFFRKKWKQN